MFNEQCSMFNNVQCSICAFITKSQHTRTAFQNESMVPHDFCWLYQNRQCPGNSNMIRPVTCSKSCGKMNSKIISTRTRLNVLLYVIVRCLNLYSSNQNWKRMFYVESKPINFFWNSDTFSLQYASRSINDDVCLPTWLYWFKNMSMLPGTE